ncbi:MAG: M15 family metallopeptidase [Aquabacterium sp.]|uniref:M15 family metallopeptidase n=1 Tax=Aquabacterium sp. TaxID=1872578 RepID=UPI0025C67183|nr:M15 family metallopeptidase [Aquabacterium sp.]MBI5926822.1 M15 family metallopeptidase [Aquabacterium sp.]
MIKVLKPGVSGAIVMQWQNFLRGQGYLVNATGLYDQATFDATWAFQKKHKLDVDGKVGNQTYGKAAMLGFEIVEYAESDDGYPALPAFAPLTSTAGRQALFGPLAFVPAPTASNPEALKITNDWATKNLVTVKIPQLVKPPIAGAPASSSMTFHKKGAEQLKALWAEWQKRKLMPLVLSYEGAYNPRFVRGKAEEQVLSNHAFATAFDINAAYNRLGAQPATSGSPGCLYELVPIAHQFGFYWGGHFSRRDGMHFELAKLL